MRKPNIDTLLLILYIALLTILIMYALTYDNYGIYKDFLLTFVAIFSFLTLIYDKLIRKK